MVLFCIKYQSCMVLEYKFGPSKSGRFTNVLFVFICRYCSSRYERSKDFAAAALAYKCTGLALMRVVKIKSMSISKDRAEIQSVQHQVPPGKKVGTNEAYLTNSISFTSNAF